MAGRIVITYVVSHFWRSVKGIAAHFTRANLITLPGTWNTTAPLLLECPGSRKTQGVNPSVNPSASVTA